MDFSKSKNFCVIKRNLIFHRNNTSLLHNNDFCGIKCKFRYIFLSSPFLLFFGLVAIVTDANFHNKIYIAWILIWM